MVQYPLPMWWNFTVSPPTLPDFYWNVKTHEERIKKICEDLWKLIQLYKMLCDAVNDLNTRVENLEQIIQQLRQQIEELYNLYQELVNRINNLETRIENLETRIENLETRVENIESRIENIEQQIQQIQQDIQNILQRITNLENTVQNLITNLPDQVQNLINQYLTSQEFLDQLTQLVNNLISGKMDLVPGAGANHIAIFSPSVDGQVIDSNKTIQDVIDDATQAVSGPAGYIPMFASGSGLQSTGLLFANMYIEATAATAEAVSLANPLSLVYVPETPVT